MPGNCNSIVEICFKERLIAHEKELFDLSLEAKRNGLADLKHLPVLVASQYARAKIASQVAGLPV